MKPGVIAATLLLASPVLQSAVIHVPGDQPTIQAGIDAAVEYSDTVLVATGVYTGPGNRNIDFGGKAVVLKSQNGPEATIIDCEGGLSNASRGFVFDSGEDFTTIVEGFTIRNGYRYVNDTTVTYGGGIRCDSTSPTIVNCVIEDCWAMMGGGIFLNGGAPRFVNCTVRRNYAYLYGGGMAFSRSSPILSGCQFISDTCRHSGGAILMSDSSYAELSDCRFEDCFSSGGNGGVYCIRYCEPTLTGCVFVRNTGFNSYGLVLYLSCSPTVTNCTFFGGGIYCSNSSSPVIDNCVIAFSSGQAVNCYASGGTCYPTLSCSNVFGNAGGDWSGCIVGQQNVRDNISADPLFCDTAAGDFHIDAISPCSPYLSGCGALIGALGVNCGAPARVWNVRADGTGDAPTIQAAIDSCGFLDTVLLRPGTYTGIGNRDIGLRGKRIVLTSSAGPDATIIDCAGGPADEHRGFYIHEAEDSTTIIEGVTVVNGYRSNDNGGAVLCLGSTPTFRYCTFRNSYAYSGGAVACSTPAASLRFEYCTIDSNTAGNNGGAIFAGSSVALFDCAVSHNSAAANGGAIHFYSSDTTMYSSDSSYISFSIFDQNSAGSNGGAFYIVNASPQVRNCTFYGHSNAYGGTMTVASYASPFFDRCLIAFNEGPAAVACLSGQAYPYFWITDIFGNSGGNWTGCIADQYGVNCNFSADPWFCDTAGGDFSLFQNSPCAPDYNVCDSLVGAFGVGCSGEMSTIEPDLMQLPLQSAKFADMATIRIGNLESGYSAGEIDPASVLVNGTLSPVTWQVLPSHPEFEGEVFEITLTVEDFVLGYGLLLDTTVQTYTVTGQYLDATGFSIDGTVAIAGHVSGDVNDDGTLNVADLTYLVAFLFLGGPPPAVAGTGDLNRDGSVNIGDLTEIVTYLFGGE